MGEVGEVCSVRYMCVYVCVCVCVGGWVRCVCVYAHMLDVSAVKLGYKVTVYNINLFTTTHMLGTVSLVSVLNVLVTTTAWL